MEQKCGNDIIRIVLFCIALILLVSPAMAAASTQIHVVKLANDGTTILNETTKTYQWMEANLPVYGDEVTNWYLQGPVFTGDRWNPTENQNLKNWGRNKGTNVEDLCDLVGGMNSGETVKIWDGAFSKTFPYENVYTPDPRQGPMIISWWFNGSYVPSFADGMRLLFLADDNVYGVWDMNQTLPAAYHYFYYDGTYADPFFPTTTGLSVKYVNEIIIYSDDAPPAPVAPVAAFSATPLSGNAPLVVQFTDESTSTKPLTYAWDFNNDGTIDNTTQSPLYTYLNTGTYTVNLTVTNGDGSDSEIKAGYISVTSAPVVDIIYDGPVTLVPGETFSKTAYNSGTSYTINETTPLGALDVAASTAGFTYDVTDKRWSIDQVLLLDNVSTYTKATGKWYAYVNDVYKDGFGNHANGLNVIELVDNDKVEFYFASGISTPSDLTAVKAAATAAVKTVADIQPPGPVMDVLFDGPVTLVPGETFSKTAYNTGTSYTINEITPLGALQTAATTAGFGYEVTDKRWSIDQVLLLDNVSTYTKATGKWYAYVNDVYKDGFGNHANGLNVIELVDNDKVEFYFASGISTPSDLTAVKAAATAAVKTVASTGTAPADWTLQVEGAVDQPVTKVYFEEGLACPNSGHWVNWTDGNGNEWSGIPLWLLVAMVDDIDPHTPDHFNFRDDLATLGYQVKITASDGYSITVNSADMARNDGWIVANALNGTPLPVEINGKKSWPLHLKGPEVFSGNQIGSIVKIEMLNIPAPSSEWNLKIVGDVTDTITKEEFAEAVACGHTANWTDTSGNVYSGVPLWWFVGVADDEETESHWTFNDTLAATNYTIQVVAKDGFSGNFYSDLIKHSDAYIVANTMNGAPITGMQQPIQMVGTAVTSGRQKVKNISEIRIPSLQTPAPAAGKYNLNLNGKISDSISQTEFEEMTACPHHYREVTVTDTNGNQVVYSGVPLWDLAGWVDDRIPHGSSAFNVAQATAGYTISVQSGTYVRTFPSADVMGSDNYIVANMKKNVSAGETTFSPFLSDEWPLRIVGPGAPHDKSVSRIDTISLSDFGTPTQIPELRILKYGVDGTTVIAEKTVNYTWMQANLPVIGDGTTAYKFEGLTLNPSNVWDPEETYPGGFKISNVVKGSRVHDLAELVGGMGSGTTITFVASDGFETTLPYSSIYTNPAVQARQGDAIIAWWGDGQYVPQYADGMRLFFTPDGDHVYGHWDMHETLPSQYWRYNFQDGVQYPSAAGLSAKYITTIKVLSSPESDWTLELDGRDIGGVNYTVAKPFLEEAIGCQFGAFHKATYTDSKGRVWEGMPLWFFVGFVDDADQHSAEAYNETMARAGYNIVITGTDDYTTTISSKEIIRSSNYLVANSLNGTHIPDGDENWPLRFTGANVSGGMTVKGVKKIELMSISAPAEQSLYLTPQSVAVIPGQSATYTLKMNSFPQGLAGFNISVSLTNPSTGEITNITLPSWVVLKRTSALPADVLWIEGVDLNKAINAGATDVTIGQITIRGDQTGVTPLTLGVKMMTADGGANILPTLVDGELRVHIPLDANFTADVKSGPAPLTVAFTDLTTGTPDPTNYLWDFGDGSTSTSKDPSHIYTSYGSYNVSLTVSNPYSQGKEEKTGYINVARYVEPFPTLTKMPTDPDNDGLYEDINGNGVIDYDDVVEFFWNMDWVIGNKQVGILPYDFNGNGYIEYDDVVLLFGEVE